MFGFPFNSNKAAPQSRTRDAGGGRAAKGIKHEFAGMGGGSNNAPEQGFGLLGGMLAMPLFGLAGRQDIPK